MIYQSVDQTELTRLLEQLSRADSKMQLTAASQLGRLGIRSRSHGTARGSFFIAASPRLSQAQERILLQPLTGDQPDLRREIAFAVGEWAGEAATPALATIAQTDADSQTRITAAKALAKIGGRQAVLTLRTIARKDEHEDVRAAAIEGLGLLASASVVVDRIAATDQEVAHTLQLLDEIRKIDTSQYVRTLADGTLTRLAA